MSAITYVKEHPWLVGGAVVIIVGGAVLLFGGSGGGGDSNAPLTVALPGPSDASIQAGMQQQQLQAEGKAHADEVAANKEVAIATLSAATTQAKYQQDTSFHVADLTAQTAQADIASKNLQTETQLKIAQATASLTGLQSREATSLEHYKQIYSYKLQLNKQTNDKNVALAKLKTLAALTKKKTATGKTA